MKRKTITLICFYTLLMFPIYWMIVNSLKTEEEIFTMTTFFPKEITFSNYIEIFTNPMWTDSLINSIVYVCLNVIITLIAAIPGAYAFSRWNFRGSNHLFFWLLTNRMAPAAVFMIPFTELYFTLHLFDTHLGVALAHCLFNIPLAVWILEGFMSAIPREIDETAMIDGYSFFRFFRKVFFPLIAPGVGVAAFFAFTFSWVEMIIAKTVTGPMAKPMVVTIAVAQQAVEGTRWGLMSALTVVMILPGALVVYFVRHYMAKGFALGRV
jgi:glycerol transport system permease protein